VNTPQRRLAVVEGADFAIITIERPLALAYALRTSIRRGASVAIIARYIVKRMRASSRPFTGIIGTFISIIAAQAPLTALARPILTRITHCTGISVITKGNVRVVLTAIVDVATIVGAGIAIIAIRQDLGLAQAIYTAISSGTGVSIITLRPVGSKRTSGCNIARIIGTRIAIFTAHR
jgi:hypothetical protein